MTKSETEYDLLFIVDRKVKIIPMTIKGGNWLDPNDYFFYSYSAELGGEVGIDEAERLRAKAINDGLKIAIYRLKIAIYRKEENDVKI